MNYEPGINNWYYNEWLTKYLEFSCAFYLNIWITHQMYENVHFWGGCVLLVFKNVLSTLWLMKLHLCHPYNYWTNYIKCGYVIFSSTLHQLHVYQL